MCVSPNNSPRTLQCIHRAGFLFIYLLHAPLLGVILHAYVECTEVINNIDTIIVTLPVVFTGSLSDIYNLLLYISCFVLFCVRLGMGMLILTNQTTQCHKREEQNVNLRHCETVKSYTSFVVADQPKPNLVQT